jgi:metal-sulfur cluster biosynthetic enzyme
MDQAKAEIEETLTLKTCTMTKQIVLHQKRLIIHSGLPLDRVNQHTIHWMPLMTQLWMKPQLELMSGFHGGNPS